MGGCNGAYGIFLLRASTLRVMLAHMYHIRAICYSIMDNLNETLRTRTLCRHFWLLSVATVLSDAIVTSEFFYLYSFDEYYLSITFFFYLIFFLHFCYSILENLYCDMRYIYIYHIFVICVRIRITSVI